MQKRRNASWPIRAGHAALLALAGTVLVLFGLAVLPLALALREIRERMKLEKGWLVSVHELLAVNLWGGVSLWVHAAAVISPKPVRTY